MSKQMTKQCIFCKEISTVAVRGTVEDEYICLCSFHAGMFQMILEKLDVQRSVVWRPIYRDSTKELRSN